MALLYVDEHATAMAAVRDYWHAMRRGQTPSINPLDEFDSTTRRRVLRVRSLAAYEVYLRSQRWREFRMGVLALVDYTCERCDVSERDSRLLVLDVHHLTYARLGSERREDVEVLCRPCVIPARGFLSR